MAQLDLREPTVKAISRDQDCLLIENRLRPRQKQEASTGTGLNSIINRYTLLSEIPVTAGEEEGDFVVRVPLLD